MGNLAVWKVLEEMVTDFKKNQVAVPADIIDDLKSARTIIKILRADPACGENSQKIDEYLTHVESYLISEGQKKFGQEYVDEWLQKVNEAGRKMVDEQEEETNFVSGVTGERKWIRLTPTKELSLEKLKSLAKESNLSCKAQNNEHLIVLGSDAVLKDFVKKIAAKQKLKTRKEH
ncbi:MAG: DUF2096 family protein [Candidatus Bathyarchaeia archaeon]|jgi:hypothetical protein